MRWQPWVRGGIALAGVGSAVAIYMLFGHRQAGPGGAPAPPVDPTTTSEMEAGTNVRQKDGRESLRIEFKKRTTYSDGRVRFDHPHLQSFDDRGLEMWADLVETKGKAVQADDPAELGLTGHVRIRTKDGLEALMDNATYHDATGVLTAPGTVTFSKARMTGAGEGATYDEKHDILSLLDRAHVVMAPDPQGHGALEATSHLLTLVRPEHVVRLDRDARIVRDGNTLSADNAVVRMTDDEARLTRIELRQQARVTPGPGKATAAPPDMRAEDIDLDLHDDGQTIRDAVLTGSGTAAAAVDLTGDDGAHRLIAGSRIHLTLARDGETLTLLDAARPVSVTLPKTADAEVRRIDAETLHATGTEPGGLTGAQFDGHPVTFAEDVPKQGAVTAPQRVVKSPRLVLELKGQLDAIDVAKFTGGVDLLDANGAAHADRAEYDATDKSKRVMHLHADAAARVLAWAENKDHRHVDARTIDLFLDSASNDLDANGAVATITPPSPPAPGHAASPLFGGDLPTFGTGASLKFRGNQATYTGGPGAPARVWQDRSFVKGDEVRFDSDTNDLHARGHVEADVPADSTASTGQKGAASSIYQVRNAGSLDYADLKRVARFVGKPVKLHSGDGDDTSALTVELTFAADSRAVQHMVWEEDVTAHLTGQRTGVGARLTYDAETDGYVLTGKPAEVLFPNADGKRCALGTGDQLAFQRKSGAIEGIKKNTPDIACDEPLPYKKKN